MTLYIHTRIYYIGPIVSIKNTSSIDEIRAVNELIHELNHEPWNNLII